MRKLIVISMLLLVLGSLRAQQTPQYSMYLFNQFGFNPAVAGAKECVDIKLAFRKQWWGFEGAPQTAGASINARLPNKRSKNKYNYHGVGVMVESDEMGPTSRTMVYLAYAYHMQLSHKLQMSAGLFAGFQQFRFDASQVTLANYNDNAIQGSQSEFIWPDIIPGFWLYSDNFYAGFTLRQLLRNRISVFGDNSRFTHHYTLNAGRKFEGTKFSFIPSAMLKIAPWSTPALDLNILVDYQNKISFGLSYRNTDAIIGMFKVNFLKHFSFGYSFDFTTSKIRYGSSNTHEVVLGIYSCPQNEGSRYECPTFN